MHSIEWDELGVGDIVRLVRALGGHRYVAATDVRVHALLLIAAAAPELETFTQQARSVLDDASIDSASRAPELWISMTHKELALVLDSIWLRDGASERRTNLQKLLTNAGLAIDDTAPLFDENRESVIHPVLIDAGWELLRLAELDPERHRGVIDAFGTGEELSFQSARFEEESAIPKPEAYAIELPAFGAEELLLAPDIAPLPFVIWVEGPEAYLDYLLRGIAKVAKISEP